jgi:hypothetical protein
MMKAFSYGMIGALVVGIATAVFGTTSLLFNP